MFRLQLYGVLCYKFSCNSVQYIVCIRVPSVTQ